MDLPEPVSEARRYCRHSGVSEKRCFKDSAWMGVGDAGDPRTWCTESRSPSSRGGDENEEGRDPEFQDFDAERSNSSARGLTGLIAAADAPTSRGVPGENLGDCEGPHFVTGVWEVFPRNSPSRSILFSRRDCLLANLSAVGFRTYVGRGVSCSTCRPACGGESRENAGGATSSFPPFFDRGVRSLTRRVRDGPGSWMTVSFSPHKSLATAY